MMLEQATALADVYGGFRIASVSMAVLVLLFIASRAPLWLSGPPQHIKLLGLAATLMPLTVIVNAIDQFFRGIPPGPAVFGSLITLLIVGFAVLLAPDSGDRLAPFLRWLERIGVRIRASRQSRR